MAKNSVAVHSFVGIIAKAKYLIFFVSDRQHKLLVMVPILSALVLFYILL